MLVGSSTLRKQTAVLAVCGLVVLCYMFSASFQTGSTLRSWSEGKQEQGKGQGQATSNGQGQGLEPPIQRADADAGDLLRLASLHQLSAGGGAAVKTPYLVAATMIKNERRNVREWVEYNLLAGFDLLVVYDNGSTDDVQDVLAPYVLRGEVALVPWPPAAAATAAAKRRYDEDLRGNVEEALTACYGSQQREAQAHVQMHCQHAAFTDAIQRARDLRARWLAVFDVDEFFYPLDESLGGSVAQLLKRDFSGHWVVQVQGVVFGTSGNRLRPPRGDLDLFSSLSIEHYTRRAPAEPTGLGQFANLQFAQKALADPLKVTRGNIHYFAFSSALVPDARVANLPATNKALRLNHYQYRSAAEADAKAAINRNPYTAFDAERDAFMGSVEDTTLRDRVLGALRERLQRAHEQWPPRRSDDYEPELQLLHPVGVGKPDFVPDLCVAVLTCRRIGLVHATIGRFVRYMAKFEPDVSYELVLADNDSGPHQRRQLAADFPLDKLTLFQRNEGLAAGMNALMFGACRAPAVLTIEDDWMAKFEDWRPHWPVIKMGLNVLQHDDLVLEVWLRDFDNQMADHVRNRTSWLEIPLEQVTSFASERSLDRAATHWPRAFQYRRQHHADGLVWGTYTNGASLKSRKNLERVGFMSGVNGELAYAKRVNAAGLASAHMCLPDPAAVAGTNPAMTCAADWRRNEGTFEGLFRHGGTRGRSPGHSDLSHVVQDGPGW